MSTTWTPPIELSPREERLCRKLEKHRRFFRFLRLHRHELFADGFEAKLLALYSDSPRGTPPKPPALLCLVVLLQALTGSSDEDAVQFAESDARWQMVLDCLGAEDAPFKKSTLVDFRSRLVRSGFIAELLRRTADLARTSGDFDPKKLTQLKVAVDSLPLVGVGRVEDTLNLLARALRLLVTALAATLALSPEQVHAQAGLRILAAPSPKTGLDRDWDEPGAMDAALTDLMEEVERLQRWVRTQHPEALQQRTVHAAREQLARLIAQDTERCGSGGHRIIQLVAPDRQLSLFDPEMRHGRKSKTERIEGYKVYLAEDLEAHVTLAAGVLPANQPEKDGADKLRPQVEAQGEVEELHIDRAFLASRWTRELAARKPGAVVSRAPRVKKTERYQKSDFELELVAGKVVCPEGQQAPIRQVGEKRWASFPAATCRACPARLRCEGETRRPGRQVDILPHEELLQQVRPAAKTAEGRARLRQRVGVEHANARYARLSRGRARYVGVAKNDFDAGRIAAANNLMALDRKLRAKEQRPSQAAA